MIGSHCDANFQLEFEVVLQADERNLPGNEWRFFFSMRGPVLQAPLWPRHRRYCLFIGIKLDQTGCLADFQLNK